jgi:hypothetical protein
VRVARGGRAPNTRAVGKRWAAWWFGAAACGADAMLDPGATDTTVGSSGAASSSADATTGTQGASTGAAVRPTVPVHRFVDVTAAANLGGIVQVQARTAPWCLLDRASTEAPGDYCIPERLIAGVAAGDLDGDAHVDLVFPALDGGTRVMLGDGAGAFVDVTAPSGIDAAARCSGAALGDVDRDGDLDLYLTGFGGTRHLLYLNDGAAVFREVAVERGAAVASDAIHIGTSAAFGDPDRDGDLDLFVGEWRPDLELGDASHHLALLRNLGPESPGWFEDVTIAAGLDPDAFAPQHDVKPGVYVFAPAFVDLDADGLPELVMTGDFGTSKLFRNLGELRFDDITAAAGVGTDRNGMGSCFADVDADGDLDWFVTAIYPAARPELGNRLYLNDGAGGFADGTDAWGVRDGGWGWGTVIFDHDHDGDLDVAMTGGWTQTEFVADALVLWDNPGAPPLREVAETLGLVDVGQGRGLVTLDHDEDGDLDLLVTHWGAPPRLFRNDDPPGAWLRVQTVGVRSDVQGRHAIVEVELDDASPGGDARIIVQQVGAGAGLYGHGELTAHFGLGDAEAIAAVRVHWPVSGATSEVVAPSARQTLVVVEPEG